MNETKQKKTAFLAGCGCLLVVFGFFATGLIGVGGMARYDYARDASLLSLVGVGMAMMAVGVVFVIWSIVYGFNAAKAGKSKEIFRYPNCFVVSRFAVGPHGNDVFDVFDGPDEDVKYFVHLKMPDGKNEEYRCAYEVFLCCGEGMRGEAVAQGNWLSQFVAYIGPGVASQGPGAI